MKFGIFYELQLPRPWEDGDELRLYQNALTQLETADRLRLRPCLGGGTSFPGGIFAFAVAGIVPRRRQPAHQEDPARPRHLPAHHQSSRPRRRARRGARPPQQRPLRIRHGRERLDHRTDAVRPRHGNQARSVRGGRRRRSSRCSPRSAPSITASISIFRLRNVVPKPVQKPHPPLWMACSQLPDHRTRRPERLWRARLPVRQRRCRARLGARLLQCDHQAAEEARRLRDQSEHGAGVVLHVRQDRRGGARARRRRHLLPVRAALLRRRRRTGSARRPAPSTCGTSTTSGSARIRKRRRRRCAAA